MLVKNTVKNKYSNLAATFVPNANVSKRSLLSCNNKRYKEHVGCMKMTRETKTITSFLIKGNVKTTYNVSHTVSDVAMRAQIILSRKKKLGMRKVVWNAILPPLWSGLISSLCLTVSNKIWLCNTCKAFTYIMFTI